MIGHDMKGKVALVTGASSGIGRATARAFAYAGAHVVLADWNFEAAKNVAEKLQEENFSAMAVSCDVSNEAQVAAMVSKAVSTFGRLDCAFNNAGILLKQAKLAEISSEEFDKVIAVNLKGVWLCMKYEITQMLKQGGGGSIVNTSSVVGHVGFPGLSDYVASKHGVIGLTRTAALDYAKDGIRINAISPGGISTPMLRTLAADKNIEDVESELIQSTPMGRMGKPEEIADCVLWLCSSRSTFVLGASILADGGFTIH